MGVAKHLRRRAAWFCLLALCFFAVLRQPVQAQTGTRKLPSAEKIVDNYWKAIGGKKQASAIRDATYDWTIQLHEQSMGLAKTQFKTPAAQRWEITFGNGQIISAAAATSERDRGLGGELRTLTGPEAANAKLQAALDVAHLVDYKKANILARVVSLDSSAAAYVVEFSSRGGARLRYLFSTSTRLLIAIHDDARKTVTRFEDYRLEGNMLEPHTLQINQGGSGELTFKLQRVSYNSGVAADAFDPPRGADALDVASLLRQVSRNQDEVEKRFLEYSLVQKETQREIDGKGVIKKETVKVFEVFPLPNREPIMKLISENGVALSADRAAKEDKRVQEEFLKAERDKDKDAQKQEQRRAERQRKKASKGQQEDED